MVGDLMTLWQSLVLGIVEGITEFLPISSTGHLILASWLLGLSRTEFQKSFEIAIQLGAIASVIMLYWRRFLDVEILKKIAVAFLPTGIIGLALYRVVKTHLLGSEEIVIWALGLRWLSTDRLRASAPRRQKRSNGRCCNPLFQSPVSGIVPNRLHHTRGVSGGSDDPWRSISWMKPTNNRRIFLLVAVPTMLAATGYDLLKNASAFSSEDTLNLAVGFLTSFVVALISIKWLIGYVQTRTFIPFGIYRILVAGGLALVWYGSSQ